MYETNLKQLCYNRTWEWYVTRIISQLEGFGFVFNLTVNPHNQHSNKLTNDLFVNSTQCKGLKFQK